jgi:hypothetical protein
MSRTSHSSLPTASSKSNARRRPARARLTLETLEDRTVPATFAWNGSVSGDWFTAANWSDLSNSSVQAVPGAADLVYIPGAPNDPVLTSAATVGALAVTGGYLQVTGAGASLNDLGNFYQEAGFVAFGDNTNQLLIGGDTVRVGGIFLGSTGTVVFDGTAGQSYVDVSGHPLPNVSITNGSAAGVTIANGSALTVNGLSLAAGSVLTLAGSATLTTGGDFADSGTLNLSVPAPNNAVAPLTVGGTLTLSATSVFNLTVGAPALGASYLFVQYGAVTGQSGAAVSIAGTAGFVPNFFFSTNQLTVTLGVAQA